MALVMSIIIYDRSNLITSLVCFLFQILFIHTTKGGKLLIDGENHFRRYHMGPCSDFTSLLFGGISPHLEHNSWTVSIKLIHQVCVFLFVECGCFVIFFYGYYPSGPSLIYFLLRLICHGV